MKRIIFILPILIFGIIIQLNGCYTQVMTPQQVVQVHREKGNTQPDISSSLNYNQNCFTCHSREELEDRYVEWKYYGITTAHNGIVVEPTAWDGPYTSPIFEPDPYGWYNPVPVQPWWLPTAVGVKTSTPATTENSGNRPRSEGSTRDDRGERPRSEPIPASSQQPQSGNTTNTAPPSPPPAVTVTKQPEQTSPPANTNTNDRAKSDSGSSSTNRPRTEGSSREGGGRSR